MTRAPRSLLVLALLAAGCFDPQYPCTSDSNCLRGGLSGSCQPAPSGRFCMFPDNGCPTHARWDTTAAPEVANKCVELSCDDGLADGIPFGENQLESDVDCGGPCTACGGGKSCHKNSDCISKRCNNGTCDPPGCNDGVRNGLETDQDCGGPTTPAESACPRCPDAYHCNDSSDCLHGDCNQNVCKTPQCDDGRLNGVETDVDCGGSVCPPCAPAGLCLRDSDCSTRKCLAGRCQPVLVNTGVSLPFTGGAHGGAMVAADYDHDGNLDLLINDEQAYEYSKDFPATAVVRFKGDGKGGFVADTSTSHTGTNSTVLVSGDFDRDGWIDLATANTPKGLSAYWEVAPLMNARNGAFSVGRVMLNQSSLGAAVADFNSDGYDDVAYTLVNGSVGLLFYSVFQGEMVANYSTDSNELINRQIFGGDDLAGGDRLVALDANGDGNADLVLPRKNGGLLAVLGNGRGRFAKGDYIPAGSAGLIGSLVKGDLNGDKVEDLVCVTADSHVLALLGDGKGRFPDQHIGRSSSAVDVVVADFDGDGILDAAASTATHGVQILYGNGKGDLVRGADLALPGGASAYARHLVVGDFNKDGKPDIAGTTFQTAVVYLWLAR